MKVKLGAECTRSDRKTRFRWAAGFLGAAVLVGSAAAARAGGFSINEAGAKATAMGGAFTATITDGSSMFYNPAGLAENDKLTASVGVTLIKPWSSFDGANPYPGEGYSVNQKSMLFFPPNFYASYPVSKGFNVSLGTWFPFGLSTAWENPDDFRGRFLSQRVDLRQYSLGLQASVKLADWLSVGAGPELRIGDVKLSRNASVFNPYTNRFVDAAHVQIVGDGFSANLAWGAGIQIKPVPRVRLGASFHSHVDQEYKGDATFTLKPTGYADLDGLLATKIPFGKAVPARTTIQYPSVTFFGAAFDVTDKLTLEVDGTYTTWKVFDETVLSFEAVDGKQVPNSVLTHNWENTWAFRAGAHYQASPKLWLAAGFLYDQTPQPDADVSPLLPDANRTGYSIGAGLKVGENSMIEASNLFLFFHQRSTNGQQKDNFNGTYKTFADLLVLNFRTSF